MDRGLPIRRLGQATVVLSVTAVAFAFSACDRSTTPGASLAPAPVPEVNSIIVITAGPMPFSPATSCATAGLLTPNLNVLVSSTRTGFAVDHVTLHLIDGSNVGGPGVTFPQPDLNRQFVDTVVHAGSSRTFVLKPTFRCGGSAPRFIQGEVGIMDASGGRSVMTADVALP
jgi:hypothetical protein